MSDSAEVRATALEFLRVAFTVLEEQHVLPRPEHLPWMSVGTDYFGPDLETSERSELERALASAFPERLRNGSESGRELDWSDRSFEFTGGYVFELLERAAAYSTASSVDEAWDRAIEDLLGFAGTTPNAVSCHRIVSHLEIDTPVTLGGEVELRRLEDPGWIDLHAVTGLPGLETESSSCFRGLLTPSSPLAATTNRHPIGPISFGHRATLSAVYYLGSGCSEEHPLGTLRSGQDSASRALSPDHSHHRGPTTRLRPQPWPMQRTQQDSVQRTRSDSTSSTPW